MNADIFIKIGPVDSFSVCDELPMTASGKVRKIELRESALENLASEPLGAEG